MSVYGGQPEALDCIPLRELAYIPEQLHCSEPISAAKARCFCRGCPAHYPLETCNPRLHRAQPGLDVKETPYSPAATCVAPC